MQKYQNDSHKERISTSRLHHPQRETPNVDVSNSSDYYHHSPSTSATLALHGRASLIRPNTAFARAVVMGNEVSSTEKSADIQPVQPVVTNATSRKTLTEERPMSNLSVLMNQHQEASAGISIPVEIQNSAERSLHDEADSASGPPVRHLVSSAPNLFPPSGVLHRRSGSAAASVRMASPGPSLTRRFSSGIVGGIGTPPIGVPVNVNVDEVRR
jgi:hypothetical protein